MSEGIHHWVCPVNSLCPLLSDSPKYKMGVLTYFMIGKIRHMEPSIERNLKNNVSLCCFYQTVEECTSTYGN